MGVGNPKILLVDDTADGREPLAILLRMSGFDVACAASGREALAYLDHNEVDLVILDLMMPDMNGTETLQRMRQGKWPVLPVMVLSASGHEEAEARRLAALGVKHYLQKTTLDFAEILQLVKGALEENEAAAAGGSKP